MAKLKLTKELVEKAAMVFRQNRGNIRTGQELSRKELRLLERAGIIKKRYRQYKNGQLVCDWLYEPHNFTPNARINLGA